MPTSMAAGHDSSMNSTLAVCQSEDSEASLRGEGSKNAFGRLIIACKELFCFVIDLIRQFLSQPPEKVDGLIFITKLIGAEGKKEDNFLIVRSRSPMGKITQLLVQ